MLNYFNASLIVFFSYAAAIFIMTLWQYADTIPMFLSFCVLLGTWGGFCPNMRPVIVSDLVGMKKAQKAVYVSYMFSLPSALIGDPFISYIYSRYGWTAAIQTIGLFGACSAIAILTLRFLTNKRLFAVVWTWWQPTITTIIKHNC